MGDPSDLLEGLTDGLAPVTGAGTHTLLDEINGAKRDAFDISQPNPKFVENQQRLNDEVNTFIKGEEKEGIAQRTLGALPVFGFAHKTFKAFEFNNAMERIQNNKAEENDFLIAGRFIAQQKDISERGFIEKTFDIGVQIPSIALEFMATGGLAVGARIAAQKAGEKIIGKTISAAVRKQTSRFLGQGAFRAVIGKGVAGTAELGFRVAFNPQHVLFHTANRMRDEFSLQGDTEGKLKLIIGDKGEKFWEAFPKGLADQTIEILSELAGGPLQRIPGMKSLGNTLNKATSAASGVVKRLGTAVGAGVINKIPQSMKLKLVKTGIIKRWLARHPAKGLDDLSREIASASGWHGPVTEFFEERLGEIARGVTGLREEFGATGDLFSGNYKKFLEQAAMEGLAFAMIPGAKNIIGQIPGGVKFLDAVTLRGPDGSWKREDLITPGGAREFSQTNPEAAQKIAEGGKLSRSQMQNLTAVEQGTSAEERDAFQDMVRGELWAADLPGGQTTKEQKAQREIQIQEEEAIVRGERVERVITEEQKARSVTEDELSSAQTELVENLKAEENALEEFTDGAQPGSEEFNTAIDRLVEVQDEISQAEEELGRRGEKAIERVSAKELTRRAKAVGIAPQQKGVKQEEIRRQVAEAEKARGRAEPVEEVAEEVSEEIEDLTALGKEELLERANKARETLGLKKVGKNRTQAFLAADVAEKEPAAAAKEEPRPVRKKAKVVGKVTLPVKEAPVAPVALEELDIAIAGETPGVKTIGEAVKTAVGRLSETPEFGSENKLITRTGLEEARARLRGEGQLGAGFDIDSAIKIGAFYIEAGVRKFSQFSAIMAQELGPITKERMREIFNKSKALAPEEAEGVVRAEIAERPEAAALGTLGGNLFRGREPIRTGKVDRATAPDNPEMNRRVTSAKGIKPISFREKLGDIFSSAVRKITRAQEFLPKTGQFDVANEVIRLSKEIPNAVRADVQEVIASILDPMSREQFDAFEDKIIADNLLDSIVRGEPNRFGVKDADEARAWKDKIDAAIKDSIEINKALENRKKIRNDLVRKLVEADLLDEKALENIDTYFHQMVQSKQNTKRSARLRGLQKKKRGFQRKRVVGPESFSEDLDYNTSYVESEFEWMAEAMIELRKQELFDTLTKEFDITSELERQAEGKEGKTFADFIPETHEIYQPAPGNMFFRTFTVADKIIEQVHREINDEYKVSIEDVKEILALGAGRRQLVFPVELVQQLESMEKPNVPGEMAKVSKAIMDGWKQMMLFFPTRALPYNLRNWSGDMDPIFAGAPGALKFIPKAAKELNKLRRGDLDLSENLRRARELGVVSSSMTAQEIPGLKDQAILKRFYDPNNNRRNAVLGIPVEIFETIKKWTVYRENINRYSAYLFYQKQLAEGSLVHFGGSNPRMVKNIQEKMGDDVAAANLSRNLIGDYGNLTVMGNWIRTHAIPFWSFQEVNIVRYRQLAQNAFNAGKIKGKGNKAATALYAGVIGSRIGIMYAMFSVFNHLVFPDEEEALGIFDRANPHLLLGRNEDGSIRIFRNVGALGDTLEWAGINDLVSLLPQYENGQISGFDLAREMAKAPINKVFQSLRPDIKGGFEVATGQSLFPDVFNPRKVARDEAVAQIFGLGEEFKAIKGAILEDGTRARPHYMHRFLFGTIDAQQAALGEMYDLREKFLAKKNRSSPAFSRGPTPMGKMRKAAGTQDFEAFKEARLKFLETGSGFNNFRRSLISLDPIGSRLNDELEAEFENDFLNSIQRKKLRMVREYASELRRQMFHWWVQAVDESGLKEEKISLKASIQKAVSNKAAFLARSNPRRERGETITAFRERVERFNENIDSSSIWLKDRGFTKKQIMNAFIEENRGKRLKRFTIGRLRMQLNRHIVNPLDPEDKAIRSILSQKSPPVEPKRLRSIRKAK